MRPSTVGRSEGLQPALAAPVGARAVHAGKSAVWFTDIATTDTDTRVPAWEFYAAKEGWLIYVEEEDALMLYNGSAWAFDVKIAGIPQFAGTKYDRRGQRIARCKLPASDADRAVYLDSGQGG